MSQRTPTPDANTNIDTPTATATDTRPYTGPTVPEMIATHTLAASIIHYHSHPTSSQIMDAHNLSTLRRFVNDPAAKEEILAGDVGGRGGSGKYTGSLAGYIVYMHGSPGQVLGEEEIEGLRGWFEGVGRAGGIADGSGGGGVGI